MSASPYDQGVRSPPVLALGELPTAPRVEPDEECLAVCGLAKHERRPRVPAKFLEGGVKLGTLAVKMAGVGQFVETHRLRTCSPTDEPGEHHFTSYGAS